MTKKSTHSKSSPKIQVRFWIEQKILQKWDEYWQNAGFSNRTAFLTACVNDRIDPLPIRGGSDLSLQITQMKQFRESITNDLTELLKQRTNVILDTPENHQTDPKIKAQVLDIISKMGPISEFYIQKELSRVYPNLRVTDVFSICAEFFRKETIKQDKRGNWLI